jgi:hypothetical protein
VYYREICGISRRLRASFGTLHMHYYSIIATVLWHYDAYIIYGEQVQWAPTCRLDAGARTNARYEASERFGSFVLADFQEVIPGLLSRASAHLMLLCRNCSRSSERNRARPGKFLDFSFSSAHQSLIVRTETPNISATSLIV